jgi:hypothetical protein
MAVDISRTLNRGESNAMLSGMTSWYALSLGDGLTAHLPSRRIEQAFTPLYEAAGKPAEMAVFLRYKSAGGLHCRVTAYFSPATADIARHFAANSCARPSRRELQLLAGDTHCWSQLFPDHP